jgi:hypothetical protein
MSVRLSTAMLKSMASGPSIRETLANGYLNVYSGTQPADADTAPSGTLLVTFTLDGGTYTAPVQAIGKVTISGTLSGSIDAITLGGVDNTTGFDLLNSASVTHTGDHSTTATAVAADINAKSNPWGIVASTSGADVLLEAPASAGADYNTINLFVAATTCTATVNGGSSSTLGGTGASQVGVAAANGLNFQQAVGGVLAKEATTWKGDAAASGTAGWFRYVAGGNAATGASTDDVRFDGSIATSGGDMTLSNLSITAAATQTINTFTVTMPAS